MGDFLDAAARTLQKAGRPMSAAEITEAAMLAGVLDSVGATPAQTMKARLSDNIRTQRANSLFMRTAKGVFALRAWDVESEYVADRYQVALLDEDAIVFDRENLWRLVPGRGLHPTPLRDGASMLDVCRPMPRRLAELDESVIQLVSAFIVKWGGKYLTYKRSARLPESRLHGEYSISFGGHLTPRDIFDSDEWPDEATRPLWNIFDPHNGISLLYREFEEELRVRKAPRFAYRGLLYDDSRAVSRQHLAIVYDVELRQPEFAIGERGFLLDAKFESKADLERRIADFENWSQMIINMETGQIKPGEDFSDG